MTDIKPVMGLDLSLSSAGVCLVSPRADGTGVDYGTEALVYAPDKSKMTKTASGKSKSLTIDQKVERLIWIRDQVQVIAQQANIAGAYIEDYAFSARSSSVTGLAELGGVVRVMLLEEFGITPIALTVSQCRKFVCGDGKVTKALTQVWLKEQGLEFATDDEGDAYVVGMTGLYLTNPQARVALDVTRLEHIDKIAKSVNRRRGKS